MRSSIFVLVFLAPLFLLPTGCGGGSGAPPGPTTDAFLGTYGQSQFKGDFGPPLTATARWGTITADGMGAITGGISTSVTNGVLGPTLPGGTGSYTILAGNRMQWPIGAQVLAEGGISADGSLAVLGVVLPGQGATIAHLARRGAGYSQASLSGTYHYAHFLASATGTGDATLWGAVTFDGAGAATYTLWSNVDGVISGPMAPTGSYSVAADGALLLGAAGGSHIGTIARGGDIGLFSGSASGSLSAGFGVFVKYSTAASNATFSGPYHFTAMSADSVALPLTNWRALTGTLNADGAGHFTYASLTQMDDHGVVAPVPGPFMPLPYTVVANGGMTIGTNAVGAISSDGSVAAFIGGTTPGGILTFWLLIR